MQENSTKNTRKTSSKKTSGTKKRSTRTKAKKPKVLLAKNKVALLCGIICGVCVLAISISVIFNTEAKDSNHQIAKLAEEQPHTKQNSQSTSGDDPIAKRQISQPASSKAESPQKQVSEQKSVQTPHPKSQPAKNPSAKTQALNTQPVQNAPEKTQSKQSPQQKKQTEKVQPVKKTEIAKSTPDIKIITKEQKESSAVKTIPQSQTSQAGKRAKAPVTDGAKSPQQEKSSQNQTVAKSSPNQTLAAQQKSQNQSVTSQQNQNVQLASHHTPKEHEQIQQNVPRNRFDLPQASNGATVVIIIDDAGRSVENTKRYAALPFPITIAVLPKLPQSRACADAIRAAGKEGILHQPMQSMNLNLDPGPGKITADMSTYEIAAIVKQNLLELGPGVKGMNNHEGSQVTSNVIKIGTVLDVCSEMGVYFLDSRTTAATQAPQAALERDMHIFEKAGPYLDNDIDRAKMLERMRETLAYANRHGRAIVIGHVDKSVKILPDLLSEMYPEMKAAGYRFATPSMLR